MNFTIEIQNAEYANEPEVLEGAISAALRWKPNISAALRWKPNPEDREDIPGVPIKAIIIPSIRDKEGFVQYLVRIHTAEKMRILLGVIQRKPGAPIECHS